METCCGSPDHEELVVIDEEGHPPGHAEHQIGYRKIAASVCKRCGFVEIERLDHDCFDFEEVFDQYQWYRLEGDDAAAFREYVQGCRRPKEAKCDCAIHKRLRDQCDSLPRPYWGFGVEHEQHRFKARFARRKLSA